MPNRKLVMEEHDGSVLVGVLQDGCDPVIKTEKGTLEAVLPNVPGFLNEARDKWAIAPKNPPYVAPTPPKPAPKPAATPVQQPKAEELPLLAGTQKPPAAVTSPEAMGLHVPDEGNLSQPAEDQAELEGRIKEAMVALPAYQEFLNGRASTDELAMEFIKTPEGQTFLKSEEKPVEAAAEVTEPPAAPAAVEPEPEAQPVEPAASEPAESAVAEDKVEQEIGERIAEAPAPPPAQPTPSAAAKAGEWDYYLQDGRGPFGDVQAALDEIGLDKENRPQHNRWDRLSTALKEKIQRRPKG